MGLSIHCNDKWTGCSYGGWYTFRQNLTVACESYLQELLIEKQENNNKIINYKINFKINNLKQLINSIETTRLTLIKPKYVSQDDAYSRKGNFEDYLIYRNYEYEFHNLGYKAFREYKSILNEYNISAILILLAYDDSGQLTVQNSKDIIKMINIVKPYLNYEFMNDWNEFIDEFFYVLKESIETNMIVILN